MDEAITISDRGNNETVIEVRETLWQLLQSGRGRTVVTVLFILSFPVLWLTVLVIILLLLIPLVYRKVRITITPKGKQYCQISIMSYFQIASSLNFTLNNQLDTFVYGVGATLEHEKRSRSMVGNFIIAIRSAYGKKIKIWVNAYPATVEKIINKILLPEKSEIEEDEVLDVENDYSPSITALLSAINPENYSILIKDNQLVFNYKNSYDCNTFGIILGGTGYTVIGFCGIFGASEGMKALFNSSSQNIYTQTPILYQFYIFLICIVFIFSTFLIFRGVHSIVKRFITESIYQIVRFDNISQLITLEEHFLTYKSTQKYFWEKAELLIAKPQNAEDYLKDKKVLALTLQKAGQPARRVELFKHQNEHYLQQLRDYIVEFYREHYTDIGDTI